MTESTKHQILWAGVLLACLLAVLWTTRYRVVSHSTRAVVLYDRWTHRLCQSDGRTTACGTRLP